MQCNNCGAPISEDSPICPNCGMVQNRTCPNCGVPNNMENKYCVNCGHPLTQETEEIYVTPEPEDSTTRNTVLIVLGIVLGFAIVALITFFVGMQFFKKSVPQQTVNTPTAAANTTNGTNTQGTGADGSTDNTKFKSSPTTDNDHVDYGSSSEEVTLSTPIMGNSGTTKQELVDLYTSNSPIHFPMYYESKGVGLPEFAQMYIEECEAENVRADLAFAQMAHETGWLQFGGDVNSGQFNFAGIGATGNGEPGYDFAKAYGADENGIRMGIRAQVQHLKAYGSEDSLNNACVDPRFDLIERGSSPRIGGLSGKWSTDTNSAAEIVDIIHRI